MAISATERIVNLALHLASSREPVSAAEIAASVPGYSPEQKPDAFARMFERDKEDLRRAGLVITVQRDEVERYLFDPQATYASEVDLSPVDAMELRAAAAAMLSDASFPYTQDLRMAVAKLVAGSNRAMGRTGAILPSASEDESPEIQANAVADVTRAIEMQKRISFSYTGAQGRRSQREVEPWGLFARDGRWYAVCWDPEAQGERVFTVARMKDLAVNTQRPKSADFERPADFDVSSWMLMPFQYGPRTTEAVLRLSGPAAKRAAAITAGQGELSERDGVFTWRITFADAALLGRWVAENGPGITVSEPAGLRDLIADGLHKVVELHA